MVRASSGLAAPAPGKADLGAMKPKNMVKDLLGSLPFTAELDWYFRMRRIGLNSRFKLTLLEKHLELIVNEMLPNLDEASLGKNLFLFASSHRWITHTTLTGLVLRDMGFQVTLGYLPYGNFNKSVDRYDLRRQDIYARTILEKALPVLKVVPFMDVVPARNLPEVLMKAVKQVTLFDSQYILQREDVKGDEPIYHLRYDRNLEAARKAYSYLRKTRPDVVIVPNGMIQEYGAVYAAARLLDIPAVTYEFGEQDRRVWLDRNELVMYHRTDRAWERCRDRKLTREQLEWLNEFMDARQGVQVGTTFAHLYQKVTRTEVDSIKATLGLDDRPVVLLLTNVLGDSATLGRTLFSESMAEWIEKLAPYFVQHNEVQWLIRIHPAETWTVGPSVAEIIRSVIPELPEHVHLIGSTEKINTYDLMDFTNLALVYTTTAGLELALRGIPVLVSGDAHFRKKGFTLDADTWEEYFALLDETLADLPGHRLTKEQIETAQNYSYYYFYEYPYVFPWHIEKIGKDFRRDPMKYVLSPKGQAEFNRTFQLLAGARIN